MGNIVRIKGKTISYQRPVKGYGFRHPVFSKGALRFLKIVGPLYLRFVEGISSVRLLNSTPFIEAYQEFQEGEKRLIIAFRHPSRLDAQTLLYVLLKIIRKESRKKGKVLRDSVHARFLYGKDVLNWTGKISAWLFPKIGNIPVVIGEPNREGLSLLRKEILDGPFPIALAPEGQISYHMNRCAETASGAASLAKWGLESGKDVTILPVALGYAYTDDPPGFLLDMLKNWEKETEVNLQLPESFDMNYALIFRKLIEATEKTLHILEKIYKLNPTPKDSIKVRIAGISEAALHSAEGLIGIEAEGSLLDRLFRIRFTGVRRLYPEAFDPEKLSPVERSNADFLSLEARIFIRHSQIVDILACIDPDYISPEAPTWRFCEYVLNLLDLLNRMNGGDISSRYYPKKIRAYALTGQPISAKEYLEGVPSRPGQKNLMQKITSSLQELSENLTLPAEN